MVYVRKGRIKGLNGGGAPIAGSSSLVYTIDMEANKLLMADESRALPSFQHCQLE
jgi:hypothetical protein